MVARRLRTVVRPHDTVVRWGGDEFLVLLEQLDDETAAQEVARRIVAVVAEPIKLHGHECNVTASVGLAFCGAADQLDADDLVRQADSAMYRVKRTGRNAYEVFDMDRDPAS
jgi:diguanylate cyclase (GGDEF)-like protein